MAFLPRGPGKGATLVETVDQHATHDAFGRARVAHPVTLFDCKQVFDNAPLFWDDQEVSGSGTTSVYSQDAARTRIGVAASTAGKRTRQTFMRFNYQPGKSQLVLMTGVLSSTSTGITAEVGQFDDNNGLFFRSQASGLAVVCRSSVTGSAVDVEVTQSQWNGDKLDGTGESGITVDPSATQIMWFDYEWLGVGTVRFGFVIDGHYILCHTQNHANDLTTVYMSTPNNPLRYSIENDGTGIATTMDHICSTVISEGGQQDTGSLGYATTGGTHVDLPSEDVLYAIVGLRLKTTHTGATVDLLSTAIAEHAGNKSYEWVLVWNPTVAGTFTYSDLDSDSALQAAAGASTNTVTADHIIQGGFGSSALKGGTEATTISNALRLGMAIDGTRDEIVLCVRPIGGTSGLDIEGAITVRERS